MPGLPALPTTAPVVATAWPKCWSVNAALQEVRGSPAMLWISHAGVARCVQWLLE